ncbi:MAG TPA: helix-turn-helix transcriptional regulator [Streptosporangiaceae bacterium]|jgi:transcriptional regulator with XRE-family HTH domain
MADRVTGPLGPRRAIASNLRRLREESGQNLLDVASALMISTSKLSRLENAQGKPNPRDIRDLIAHYNIQGTSLAKALTRHASAAQVAGWWTDFDDDVLESLDAHLAYETDAAIARTYTLPFVPALLQLPEYAEAVFRDMEHRSEEHIEQLLALRRRRQQALIRREDLEPLELVAVTHESSLRQVVGSPAILRRQLAELVERSTAPNIRLRVLPFNARPTFSMTCMYAYFEYKDAGESDVVHIETPAGFFSVEDPHQVRKYRQGHKALMEASLSESDSRDLIHALRGGGTPRAKV